jgi:hypothetical protein
MPPTPTYIPPGTPVPINLDVGMWEMSPNVVGLWGQFRDYTPAIQIMIVGLLLVFLFWTISTLIKKVSEEEA